MSIRDFDGHTPRIDASAFVDETALVIGDVEIGADSSLWPMVVARGDIHRIRIGARSNIQDGSVIHVTHDSDHVPGGHPVVIGDGVTVGHQVTLHGCTIEDDCLIGMGSLVLDGARIERGTLLGAGSLVSPGKVLEGGYLWLGRPAKRIRPLTAEERGYLGYSADHYVRLKERHRRG
ncbi:gamma carbonic anhydrase family protein [Thiohalobacter sp. IOR34]|uniref:gamma carbonic anhydrase family protein n=1 Tax=Thiohalobacter sp. IOR34 TaxID=3057176 RepID=UPI0025AEFA2A|nr:gamma carbonic anhydrase family protein [Thiohalobacter sp. IOR34]WJW75603.1 gamma carbonic anhydrase family protein [Thiohalobacter sp. IOR34]